MRQAVAALNPAPTGFWLEEFTAPYYVFTDARAEITVASVKGGQPPIDPKSDEPGNQTDSMGRFKKDPAAQKVLANTVKLSEVTSDGYDTVFYLGGHGPLWDLAEDRKSIALIEEFYNAGKPVAAVCHAPAVFKDVTYQRQPIVKGKRVTGFSNREEEAIQLTSGLSRFFPRAVPSGKECFSRESIAHLFSQVEHSCEANPSGKPRGLPFRLRRQTQFEKGK